MVTIRDVGGPRAAGPAAPGRAARGGGFRLPAGGAGGTPPAAGAAPAEAAAAAGLGLLAVQEHGGDKERDAEAGRRGAALLEALAALQRALLAGRVHAEDVARLTALCGGEAGADPGLREAVSAIETRARVELARLTVARGLSSI